MYMKIGASLILSTAMMLIVVYGLATFASYSYPSGLDLRVINSKNFAVSYVSSLQKQIYGYEVSADIFRFFDDTFVELQAGHVRNEPLQLGVRNLRTHLSATGLCAGFWGIRIFS